MTVAEAPTKSNSDSADKIELNGVPEETVTDHPVSNGDSGKNPSMNGPSGPEDDVMLLKEQGNRFFAQKEYSKALEAYQEGLCIVDQEENPALCIALRSNLAMVHLKLEHYVEAEEETTWVLNVATSEAQVSVLKALYRRALAREGQAMQLETKDPKATSEQRHELLELAQKDLRDCLEMSLKGGTDPMKSSAQTAFERISSKLPQIMSGQRRQDIVRLLMARQQTNKRAEGEAFFLLDWKWWSNWCRFCDFFYTTENPKKQQLILRLLPPGAILPDKDEETKPPGIIDNSRLFLKDDKFHRQFYQGSELRPNLVRGYHYELLPREAYMALRSWYGEMTPSVCRRTRKLDGDVLFLPLYEVPEPPPKGPRVCGACGTECSSKCCKRCHTVYYCDRSCQESHWPFHRSQCGKEQGATIAKPLSGRVGLNNLGNTCFMNSALQCLSHATPLTRHFLSQQFRADLNTSNPLGTGGKLANAYDVVLRDLWMRGGTSTSPTALKRAIALFAPRFAGCSQHDAQEFLAYLLDGLHEDLNRIRQAPYVEMPDVTDGQNMAIAGAEAWDAHKRRNDSLVMDTFYGQFKSTCVCPKCNRISVSFDAFNHVSLEIPQLLTTMMIPVLVFFANGEVVRFGVLVRRSDFCADLKNALSGLCKVPKKHLILCDIFENLIYDILQDNKPVSNIRPSDLIAAYEVDPYTDSTIHVVAKHIRFFRSTEKEGEAGSEDKAEDDDDKKDEQGEEQPEVMEPIGFPFMTSFSHELSCKEVWDHLWSLVRSRVVTDDALEERYKSLLHIRIVDNAGKPIHVFKGEKSEAEDESLLPRSLEARMADYLGEDCTQRFLYVTLEWNDTKNEPSADDEEDSDEKDETKVILLKKRFYRFSEHPSLHEAIAKHRALNGSKGVTLDQCFETFTKPERLDEHNQWYCSSCKEHVRAMKTMKLWRLPNVLVVHLKRFEFKHALRRDKLDTFVDFPLEGLDMGRHCASYDSGTSNEHSKELLVDGHVAAEYDLFGVVNHFGRMGFGHYTAYARKWDERGVSDEWCLFDDARVRSVGSGKGRPGTIDAVASPAAYVLFYRRRVFN